jgi:hypothetical protein
MLPILTEANRAKGDAGPHHAQALHRERPLYTVRDAITQSTDLTTIAEDELVWAHSGLSRRAAALEASRTMWVHMLDLVVAARELRRIKERE